MARHKKQEQADGENVATQTPALEQGGAADPVAQSSDGPTLSDPIMTGAPHPAAEAAARNYAQEEIERSNRIAREQDARAVGPDGKQKESKAERFVRLAPKRVTKALLVLSHVQNLTNSNSYSYTPEQAQKVVDALVNAVEKIANGFSGTKNGKQSFTL